MFQTISSALRRISLALAALTLVAPAASVHAHDAALAPELEADVDFVLDLLEHDYAGFPTKTEGREEEYAAEVALMRARIAERPDARIHAISALLDWFEDDHMVIRSNIVSPADPWPPAVEPASRRPADSPDEFTFRRLSDDTVLVTVPDFDASSAEAFHALLAEHHDTIVSTPNLVIDMRGNGGGSDYVYKPLMAYLYSRPIYSIGAEIRVSERNIAAIKAFAATPGATEAQREFVDALLARIGDQEDGFISMWDKHFSITTFERVHEFPRRVGILAQGAGSSGDQFVIDARASRKVTLFGGPTAGVIDYSNVMTAPAPSGDFDLRWPISRSMRLPEEPLDNVGVPADVPFGPEVTDEVEAVRKWLERQPD